MSVDSSRQYHKVITSAAHSPLYELKNLKPLVLLVFVSSAVRPGLEFIFYVKPLVSGRDKHYTVYDLNSQTISQ